MKYIYYFDELKYKNNLEIGKKGSNLKKMEDLKLTYPSGFIITTDAFRKYYEDNKSIDEIIKIQIDEYIRKLELQVGKKLGNKCNPLFLSIKISDVIKIPNMMDTIINLGFNDEIVDELIKNEELSIWALKSYLTFIQMYSCNIMNINNEYFNEVIDNYKENKQICNVDELEIDDLKILINQFKKIYEIKIGSSFSMNPREQLENTIIKAYESWNNDKACIYRKDMDIPFEVGIALIVQEMKFSNINNNCIKGRIYTRDIIDGENIVNGNIKINTQFLDEYTYGSNINLLKDMYPEIYDKLINICKKLDDEIYVIDFIIENNELYILQINESLRTLTAALRVDIEKDYKKNESNKDINYPYKNEGKYKYLKYSKL